MLLRKKEEIENWLNTYQIKNYHLIEDKEYGYIVNVDRNVNLISRSLKTIEVKFNEIYGFFDCDNNELTSLEGCPEIINGSFSCTFNLLLSLKGCPKKITGNCYLNNNSLSSLEYSTKIINGDFLCMNNKLDSLEFCPKIIGGDFACNFNNLKSLKGCPKIIQGYLDCSHNQLISLKGCPEIIEGSFDCNSNNLDIEGLFYLPKKVKNNFYCNKNEKLSELQDIVSFEELKKRIKSILRIKEEKKNLLKLINKDNLNIKNNINKI